MLTIAICDDEKFFRDTLEREMVLYLDNRNIKCQIDKFGSGEELLVDANALNQYDLICLDVNMEPINGIETLKRLRSLSIQSLVVLVTAFINYAVDGYKYDVVRYLVKDNDKFRQTFEECMETVLKKVKKDRKVIRWKFIEGEKVIPLDSLVYIESHRHKIHFVVANHLSCEEFKMYDKLSNIENKLLPQGFLRIHQSFLVNLSKIKKIQGLSIVLYNDSTLPISKARYKEVKERFVEYRGEI